MNLQRREGIRKRWGTWPNPADDPHANEVQDYLDICDLFAHIDTLEQSAAERVIARGAVVKPHTFGEIVNQVRDIANQYAGTEQLRERIAHALAPHFERDAGPTPDYTGEGSAWVPPAEAREAKDPWESSKLDYDRSIHSNRDAKAWADFFVATYPGLADKHDIMLGWFANAMMAMHDSLKQEAPAVVVPPLTPEWCDEIWRNAPRNVLTWAVIEWICKQDRERFRAIPADRVLGEGERRICSEELMYLQSLERYARKHGPESIQDVIGCLDHLRANQGGAAT